MIRHVVHERNPRTTDTGWVPYLQGTRVHSRITALRSARTSGVYAIRDRESRDVLYVGESHTGRLYGTLMRHMQDWRGRTQGKVYDPETVEVRIMRTAPTTAREWQERWIERLMPSDNTYLSAPLDMEDWEEAPF